MGVPVAPAHQLKVPVVRRPAFTLYLEQATAEHTFIHCTVHKKWSLGVKRQLQADLRVLHGLHGGPIHALHTPGDRKHLKFLRMLGFKKVASYKDRYRQPKEIHSI